jgi:hypothetical protein
MFGYDSALLAAVEIPPKDISDVLTTMRAMDSLFAEGDGLKWFNWLYLEVTDAVAARVAGGGFHDPAWLTELDVQFARLYFDALGVWLANGRPPGCWKAVFQRRGQTAIARVQFALAGINAHINHDLAKALVATCRQARRPPRHGTPRYADYVSINSTLDGLIDEARQKLQVRLLGDPLPTANRLEDTLAAWSAAAAREKAWINAEILWALRPGSALAGRFLDAIDGLTTALGKVILAPVP